MTEAEWLAASNPDPMIGMLFCRGDSEIKGSERKQRLFACACARRVWALLIDERSRTAFEIGERTADGLASEAEQMSGIQAANDAIDEAIEEFDFGSQEHASACVAHAAIGESPFMVAYQAASLGDDQHSEEAAQATVLRELFGNPFRPALLATRCRTAAVLALATGAYAERAMPSGHLDPARLAVLSDALEEAGCTDEAILSHLRSPGPHVRGCWALDLVMGKE